MSTMMIDVVVTPVSLQLKCFCRGRQDGCWLWLLRFTVELCMSEGQSLKQPPLAVEEGGTYCCYCFYLPVLG